METLRAARNSLKISIDKSKAISFALEKAGSRLDEINQRLPSLAAAVRPIRAHKEALLDVPGHIDRAVGPAAAVLKVFDAIHGLEKSLFSDPRYDLAGYLSVLQRLEEALKFLADNCGLAIQWLEDIVEYLEDHNVADNRYLSNLKNTLRILRELEFQEHARLDGGLLDESLNKLQNEFQRLLIEPSSHLPIQGQRCVASSSLSEQSIHKLRAILVRLTSNDRLNKCISIYIETRSAKVKMSLQPLGLDYLKISASEISDVQSIESYISKWGKHLEFTVKHLFEAEYKLCNDTFERMGPDMWMDCFAKIATESGIFSFLQFGKVITECKKDPIKLLKLLEIFASLNNLRLDFNRLFGNPACIEIQNLTRELIKSVVSGACEIFCELLIQVELQRQNPPPSNGSVPKLASFMVDYCNKLVEDKYRPILIQVLTIHRSWNHEKFHGKLLVDSILKIIHALVLNLETWAKAYEDTSLSYLFLMNNHWHLYKHLEGTTLGTLLGTAWLRKQEQYKDYYANLYLRETWARLPALLSREGLIVFSGGRATARDLVKKRLKAFNEMFDELYRRQSRWVVPESDLREKTCQSAVQIIVPVYRSYMQSYGPLVEQDISASRYAKYSAQKLEDMIGSLFEQKVGSCSSRKIHLATGKLNNVMTNQLRSASTVA